MDTIVSRSNDIQQEPTQEIPTINDLPEAPEVEETTQEEQQEQTESSQEETQATKTQKSHDQSFRELRSKQEETERRLEEAQRYIRDIEARTRPTPQEPEPEPSDSDLVEWKHVKKHVRSLQQELSEIKQQSMQQQEEARLRTKYPDIDAVVTTENMAQLRRVDPEAAAAIDQASSLYSKGMLAYRLIKQSNIVDEQEYVPQQKINKNALKPRSVATVNPSRGQNPLDKANSYIEFTDDMAKQLYKEMDEASRRR